MPTKLLRETDDPLHLCQSLLEQSEKIGKLGSWWIELNDTVNLNNNPLKWSAGVYHIFGYKPGEVEITNDLFYKHVHPDDREKVASELSCALKNNIPYNAEHRIIRADGKESILLEHAEIKRDRGKIVIIGVVRDLTDEKKAAEDQKKREELISCSLKEKETLLKELYHRTKNNMQIISSLLSLKSFVLNNPEINLILQEMKNRIQTIALVHHKLYQTKNLSRIDLKEYIEDLVHLLKYSYLENQERITYNIQTDSIKVLIDTAVPFGLLFNELVSNSIKYAFPDDKKGTISVKLFKTDKDQIELQIADDGIGIDKSKLESESTLGLQLFKALSEQLNAQTEVLNDIGVCWKIRFNDTEYIERI